MRQIPEQEYDALMAELEQLRAERVRLAADVERLTEREQVLDSLADALDSDLKDLSEIVAKLPKTADGEPVVPGMTIYRIGARGNVNTHEVDWVRAGGFKTEDNIHFSNGSSYSTVLAAKNGVMV